MVPHLAARQDGEAGSVTVREYARLLRKQWALVMICLVATVGVAAALSLTATPQYAASVKMFVSSQDSTQNTNAAYQGGLFSQQRAKSYAELLSGPRIAEAVVADLGLPVTPENLQRRLSARAIPDTVLLQATVTDPVPSRARDVANALGTQFAGLVTDLERPEDGGPSLVKVTTVEEAKLPTSPVSPATTRNLALAALLGTLLGVGLALLRETLDTSVKTPEDVAAAADGLATLGAVGFDSDAKKRPLINPVEGDSRRAEALRQLRTNLQFVDVAAHPKSIVVTSSVAGEGKSTTACNLAITLAQAGLRVVLVEADLRRPRLMTYLGMEGAVGVTNMLIHRVTLDEAIQPWGNDLLDVLPSGPVPPNPSELLGCREMAELMKHLEERYDIVLIDGAPLLPVTDAAVLSALAGGALLVVRANKTHRDQLHRAVASLRAVDARLLGAVLNFVPTKGAGGYHYGYEYTAAAQDRRRDRRSLVRPLGRFRRARVRAAGGGAS
jgi:capsular exopolysaccharide synthesis family protein